MKNRQVPSVVTLLVAAGVLMAFAGSASATSLASPAGPAPAIEAASSNATLHLPSINVSIPCGESTITTNPGTYGAGVPVVAKISKLTFTNCFSSHVSVLSPGSLAIDTVPGTSRGNGTLASTGAEITVQITSVGISCVLKTNNTHMGTLTGSTTKSAVLDIDSAFIARTGHSFFCGSSGKWTGTYNVTSPSWLYVDGL